MKRLILASMLVGSLGAGHGAPRPSAGLMSVPLKLKAEAVLAVQLVSRHRATRLAVLLVLLLIAAVAAGEAASAGGRIRVVLVAAGTLGAVAGSRLLAPGGALAAARMSAADWWLAPTGRLLGAVCIVAPVGFVGVVALLAPRAPLTAHLATGAVTGVYALAVLATTAALAPAWGASAAAALGFFGAWLGPVPPSDVYALFAPVPLLQHPLVLGWNVLPLPWRAARWIEDGTAGDGLLLIGWIALGILAATWSTSRYYRAERDPGASR